MGLTLHQRKRKRQGNFPGAVKIFQKNLSAALVIIGGFEPQRDFFTQPVEPFSEKLHLFCPRMDICKMIFVIIAQFAPVAKLIDAHAGFVLE